MTEDSLIRALIADDEPIARRRLARLLARLANVVIVGEAGDCDQTLAAVRQLRPDLLFLDIQMPGGDGFSVIDRLGAELPPVIFVTAFDHYALRAFEAAPLDYLTKPVEMSRLTAAVTRARATLDLLQRDERIAELQATVAVLRASIRDRHDPADNFWIRGRLGHDRIRPDEIDYVRAERDYVRLFLAGQQSHLVAESMASLENRIADLGFLRIHRSTMVRQAAIRGVARRGYGSLIAVLNDGTELTVGRSYAGRVLQQLGLESRATGS